MSERLETGASLSNPYSANAPSEAGAIEMPKPIDGESYSGLCYDNDGNSWTK
jgi:hypothetical protein